MNWPATERHCLTPAPGGLALVQELLNTASAGHPDSVDLLADGALDRAQDWADLAVRGWAGETGRGDVRLVLAADDLLKLRCLRDQLGRALAADDGSGGAVRFTSAPVVVALSGDGVLTVEPEGAGARWLASAVLAEALLAQASGLWRRLKICRNDSCRAAFYDRSRNNSGVWHSVRGCGNAAHLRACRERRRTQQESGVEL
ncbi:CGNR zinc finger domain-containing protein [Streptomyces kanamyceticus]|uniref:CGNR zinc finger domain-containing protein n=1 Tax=Streptomyces kanamyceticus TaxID=1967 RepID=A0A5J6GUL9_STRKN|nr:CGNR zinc finger domain-containing protein [Streptomyces kanamyceticus]QEU97458.1 CGNR zinc finger domain-containing protein [Streptomyces kanamyceticus]